MTLQLEHTTTTELETLAQRVLRTKLAKEAAEADFKEADAEFRAALEEQGKLNTDFAGVGNVRTAISHTRRFSEDLALQILPKKLVKECSKTVLDSALVKRNLSPIDYERCQAVTGFTIRYSFSDH